MKLLSKEIIDHYIIRNYGNLILHDPPEFNKEKKLWVSRLRSDYPVFIRDDKKSSKLIRFMKVSVLGYVVFDNRFHLVPELTTSDDNATRQLETFLDMWRNHVEELVVAATADKLAELPEVAYSLNPISEIITYLIEEDYIRPRDIRSSHSDLYLTLLDELRLIRKHGGKYTSGNTLISLLKNFGYLKTKDLMKKVFGVVLSKRYDFLRDVIGTTTLQRLIRTGNIVYYPELYMRNSVLRDKRTLLKEYRLEYRSEISAPALFNALRKLYDHDVIEKTESYYHGTKDVRNRIFEIQQTKLPPGAVWNIASPA